MEASAQFAALTEKHRLEKVVGERRSQYDVLLAETTRLRAEAEASQRESFEVTEYLRGEILAKDERIAELQVQLNEAQQREDDKTEELKKQHAEQEAATRQEAGAQNARLRKELAEATSQLRAVEEYAQHRESLEAELLSSRAEVSRLQNILEKEMAEAELAHVEQLGRVRKEADARVAEALRRAEADIGERLAASTKRILRHNVSMEDELQVHMAETAELTREVEALREESALPPPRVPHQDRG
eukprot:jgi/Botrbrau1/7493/Bobra.0095s0029.1